MPRPTWAADLPTRGFAGPREAGPQDLSSRRWRADGSCAASEAEGEQLISRCEEGGHNVERGVLLKEIARVCSLDVEERVSVADVPSRIVE